jgi:two-component system, chemotaxis family, protein-glutamate methylesterase/glutaminase
MAKRIKVLIVDNSALMRQLLVHIFQSDPELHVVGTASDALDAREKVKTLDPDVLTLDIELPGMDGLTFLEKLMRGRPMPVVMVSSLTDKGADTTLRALSLGAVDYITKPKYDASSGIIQHADLIVTRVKAAANATVHPHLPRSVQAPEKLSGDHLLLATREVVAIGSSTGGTEALRELLSPLPVDFPGIVVVQHMSPAFTMPFANRLNTLCNMRVKEAADGDPITRGQVLVAPGGYQMEVVSRGNAFSVRVYKSERVNRHIPSVDVLFRSCAANVGKNAYGVILTGMGADGAHGMLEMKQAKGHTIAQDEATSVVFGMPKEAIRLGGVVQVLPLGQIGQALLQMLRREVAWRPVA